MTLYHFLLENCLTSFKLRNIKLSKNLIPEIKARAIVKDTSREYQLSSISTKYPPSNVPMK
jgi:hypothetical protein